MPMFMFMSVVLGLLVIGQTLTLLYQYQVGSTTFFGTIMVAVVVRELGPLITAMLVLSRSGTANVIELGTARALGEVEALEALGIDPVHYLVMPRVIGMALGSFRLDDLFHHGRAGERLSLGIFAKRPLTPGEYFRATGRRVERFGLRHPRAQILPLRRMDRRHHLLSRAGATVATGGSLPRDGRGP